MRLQVEPEFRLDAEPISEAKRRVSSDRKLAIDNPAYSVCRHIDLSCELGWCNSDFRKFDIVWNRLPFRPLEADASFPVYADGILPFPIVPARLQPVTRQFTQRLKGRRGSQDRKSFDGLLLETAEFADHEAFGKPLRLLVSVTENHQGTHMICTNYVKHAGAIAPSFVGCKVRRKDNRIRLNGSSSRALVRPPVA